MTISIVYVYPVCRQDIYANYALRFIYGYQEHQPNIEHESIVVLNGGGQTSELSCLFSAFPNLRFIEHDNSGLDIGAFQKASQVCDSDVIVFFGVSTYFKNSFWLQRMASIFAKHGNGLYGAMGNCGNRHIGGGVYPHLRTTAFWTSPALFNSYPEKVTTHAGRYPFEHGPNGLTSWAIKKHIKILEVTATRELPLKEWSTDPNGYHHGNQSALLVGDRMTEPPFYHIP